MKFKFDPIVFIPFAYFILLATVIPFLTIEGKNYLFIGFSVLGIIVLTFISSQSFPVWREPILFFILMYLVGSSLYYFETAQVLSLVYSFFFIVTFVFYFSFIREKFNVSQYRQMLKVTFCIYFVGLLAGQFLLYTDHFIPIARGGTSIHGLMGVLLEPGGFRFYSFSSEPSYAAFIVITLFYSYLVTDPEKKSFFEGDNRWLILMLIYMIVWFKSVYGILLIGALMGGQYGFNRNMLIVYSVVPLTVIGVLLSDIHFSALDRIVKIATEVDVSNIHTLANIDFTSYYRLAPFLHYFEVSKLTDPAFYLGHGAAASKLFIVPEIYKAYPNGEFAGGFFPSFMYDYGIVGAFLVLIFALRKINILSLPFLVVGLMLLNGNFNTQLFWLIMLCFSLNHYFLRTANEPVR